MSTPSTESGKTAVVLLSGGLDSTTVLAMANAEGYALYALSFRYGQRHDIELAAARWQAEAFAVVEHLILDIDLGQFGGSALTGDIPVPKADSLDDVKGGIPVTYVPARNTIFLSLALAAAETRGCQDIFIGVNALDYSGYPDCRPEYIRAFQRMANLATRASVEGEEQIEIHAPLIDLTKAEIIRRGLDLRVDYSHSFSCYDPADGGEACGRCEACLLRLKGFAENGIADPAAYVSRP